MFMFFSFLYEEWRHYIIVIFYALNKFMLGHLGPLVEWEGYMAFMGKPVLGFENVIFTG